MEKIEALFFAANPMLMTRLNLEDEIREITEKIRRSKHRDSIVLIPSMAAQPDDLLQKLNEYKPHIVHFSAHGTSAGELLLLDKTGNPKPVSANAINTLFETLKDNIRVVILNACYSKVQALAIRNVIDCVIGMKSTITDNAAIVFSAAFYRAIGFGCSVKKAFEQGRTALLFENISEADIPDLLVKDGVDPDNTFILQNEKKPSYPGFIQEIPVGRSIIEKPTQNTYRYSNTTTIPVLKKEKNKIFEYINFQYWLLNIVLLVSEPILKLFVRDSNFIDRFIEVELIAFCIIILLEALYLILISLENLKESFQKFKTDGLKNFLKDFFIRSIRYCTNQPAKLIFQIFLFILFFPIVLKTYNCFLKSYWASNSFLQILIPTLSVFNIIFIDSKSKINIKRKTAEGIKILSMVIIVLTFVFLLFPEIKTVMNFESLRPDLNRKYTTNSKSIISQDNSKKLGIRNTENTKVEKKKPTSENKVNHKDFIIVEIPLTAEGIGKNQNEACDNAIKKAIEEYNQNHSEKLSLNEDDIEIGRCSVRGILPTDEIIVIVNFKIKIKKEKL